MAGWWQVVAQTGEGLVDRGGLDYSLIGKLLVGRRGDRETWGRALPSGGGGGLHGSLGGGHITVTGLIIVPWGFSAVLLACFDDLSLPLPYVDSPLKLLTHGGVLGVEARRQAGKADILNGCTVL